jgi:hypothetical protein
MLPLDFPEHKLPHGLKDCRLLQYAVDYMRRGVVVQLAVDVTEGDGDLQYRTGRLLFTELVFCSVEPPKGKSETNERELWVPGVYVLEKDDLEKQPFGPWVKPGQAWVLDLADLDASMCIVAAMCRFEWTAEI